MQKRIFKLLLSFMMFFNLLTLLPQEKIKAETMDKRALWISYLDMDSLQDKDKTTFTNNFNMMCKTAKQYEFNTLIVQVRPFSDALYPSKYYHYSGIIRSDYTSPNYDPLKIMVDRAHAYGLKIEAWINPYRLSTSKGNYNAIKKYSPLKSWLATDKVIKKKGTNYFYILNPAKSEVQDYVVNGMAEIVENYRVDGIHMDDYFYVNGTFEDTSAQQRRTYVNQLVKKAYAKIKAINKKVTFGISPQGNLSNCRSGGADIDTWLSQSGYVDYVMPQIYWSDQWGKDGKTTMFSDRMKAWTKLWKKKDIKLYAGLALYNANEKPAGDIGWAKSSHNIESQVQIVQDSGWNGYSMFMYSDLLKKDALLEMEHLVKTPVKLSATQLEMVVGTKKTIQATTINPRYSWSSSNTDIATVDQQGNLTAKRSGTVEITVETSGNEKASCKIKVIPINLTVNKTALCLYEGTSNTLKAIVNNGKQAAWSSSNSKIASINSKGVVTAKKRGSVYVTATYGSLIKKIKVNVLAPKMVLNKTKMTLYAGQSAMLYAKVTPSNKPQWKSSNPSIASIDKKGKLTSKKKGKVTITATCGSTVKKVAVTVNSPSVKLNKTKATIYSGKTLALKAKIKQSGIRTSWKSSNSKIATVNSKGVVTAKKPGSVTITATAGNVKKSCKLQVKKYIKTTKITLNTRYLTLHKIRSYQLKAYVYPKNATTKSIIWSSSNKKVATVSSKGFVRAKKKGTVYITAKSKDGKKITCKVSVKR